MSIFFFSAYTYCRRALTKLVAERQIDFRDGRGRRHFA